MATGKVSLLKSVDLSHSSKRCGAGIWSEYNRKDVEFSEVMDVDDGVVVPPQKKRKFSPAVWDSEGGKDCRAKIDDEDELEPGELDEEDYSRAPNISTSRWAVDEEELGEGEVKGKVKGGRSSSPESGITQKDGGSEYGSDGLVVRSSSVSGGGFSSRYYCGDEFSDSDSEIEDRMEVEERGDESDSDSDEGCTMEGRGSARRSMLQGCRSVYDFERIGVINEGTYGVVHKARDKSSGELVALKKMKTQDEREGFPLIYLREINTLLALDHPSIVNVREVVVDDNERDGFNNVFMVMDYVEHDLKMLMEKRKQCFSQSEVKCLMLQLLEGVKYLHDNWVIHRDLKTSNLLVNNSGELKICDFGMARQYGSSPSKPYTSLVVTLWYRAPELLLGAKGYSTAVDMWSVGCIMAELLTNKALFDGKSEPEQINKIFKVLGTPNEKIWPGLSKLPGAGAKFVNHRYNQLQKLFPRASFTGSPVLSDLGVDLLSKLLTYDPDKRITAEEALNHCWFQEIPLPKTKDFMPTFPPNKALTKRCL